MARPRKEGMDYFPHNVDTSNDEKIEAMTGAFGAAGYAFYFIALERIYRAANFELAIPDDETIKILAKKCLTTPKKFMPMLELALKVGLFDNKAYAERRVLTSEGIKRRAKVVIDKRARMYGRNGDGPDVLAGESQQETDARMTQSKAEGTEDQMKDKEQGSKADDQSAASSEINASQSAEVVTDEGSAISEETLRKFTEKIDGLIRHRNANGSPCLWRATMGSLQEDLRELLVAFSAVQRRELLEHAGVICQRQMSWFEYVDVCVRHVIGLGVYHKINAHFKYAYDMLKHPERFIFPP